MSRMIREYIKDTEATLYEATALGAGTALPAKQYTLFTFEIIATGATVDASVAIQASLDGVNWVTYDTFVLTEAGNQMYTITNGKFSYVIANIIAYVAGTITVLSLFG